MFEQDFRGSAQVGAALVTVKLKYDFLSYMVE